MVSLARTFAEGRHNIQLGDNNTLIDWVYAGNAADAYLLAADLLPSDSASSCPSPAPHPIAGQAFFISNGTPVKPYYVYRLIMKGLGDDGSKKIVKISRPVALVLAWFAELWAKVTGRQSRFTMFVVKFMTSNNWYSIEKVSMGLLSIITNN
jgi:sterol-4alpha-carboxylate 3-dehydrogenase (decarboxylating)